MVPCDWTSAGQVTARAKYKSKSLLHNQNPMLFFRYKTLNEKLLIDSFMLYVNHSELNPLWPIVFQLHSERQRQAGFSPP